MNTTQTRSSFGREQIDSGTAPAPDIGTQITLDTGCDESLPERLLNLDGDGGRYVPIQVSLIGRSASAAQQAQAIQFLLAPRQQGGHEALISANARVATERALSVLDDRLVRPSVDLAVPAWLAAARDAARERQAAFLARARKHRETLIKAEERVNRFRQDTSQLGGARGLGGLVKSLLGTLVPLPEAVHAYNQMQRALVDASACDAAAEVAGTLAGTAERILAGVGDTCSTARAGVAAAGAYATQLLRDATGAGRSGDYVVSPEGASRWLQTSTSIDTLLPELFAHARMHGADGLLDAASAIALREARRRIDEQDLLGLMQCEAVHTPVDGKTIDPAQAATTIAGHLVRLARVTRLSARLSADAGSAVYVVQVAPNERGPFRHASLINARHDEPVDEITFARVDSDIALDELALIQEGRDAFIRARAQREFFILDELYQSPHDIPRSTKDEPSNLSVAGDNAGAELHIRMPSGSHTGLNGNSHLED